MFPLFLSKSALNQLTKNIAIEYGRKKNPVLVLLYHPGTVETDLSAPFRRNVPQGQLFTVDYAATCLLKVVGEATLAQGSGRLLDWAGKEIPW